MNRKAALALNEERLFESSDPAKPDVNEVPLCVDLDKTLIWTDTLMEASLSLLRQGTSWLNIPKWLFKGKAYLKRRLADASSLDVATLPYNEPLLAHLRKLHQAGRRLVLCTGADYEIANRIAAHTEIFDEVLASDGHSNLVAQNKSRKLQSLFGTEGFDYVGDSRKDVAAWKAARRSYVVNPSRGLLRLLKRRGVEVAGVFTKPHRSSAKTWARALRLHQWAKNLLIFVPLVLSHQFGLMTSSLGAFLAFGLAASAGYLINDLLDLNADRKHARKKNRPFASGTIPVEQGIAAIPVLLVAALGVTLSLPPLFGFSLAIYFCSSLTYSLWLKRRAPIDVVMLAGLYVLRVAAGGAATGIVISPWTLAVSMFLFLSLAMVKRVSELRESKESAEDVLPGRMYVKADLNQLSSLGGAAGYLSVLITALYINSADVQTLYSQPQWLWMILPIMLHWITRLWLYTNRGWIHHDPLVFALKDRATYVCGVFALVFAALAT